MELEIDLKDKTNKKTGTIQGSVTYIVLNVNIHLAGVELVRGVFLAHSRAGTSP